MMVIHPTWIKSFKEMLEFFSYEASEKTAKMILAMFIGIPIPLISVFLLKSIADYVGTDINDGLSITPENGDNVIVSEEIKNSDSSEENNTEKKTII